MVCDKGKNRSPLPKFRSCLPKITKQKINSLEKSFNRKGDMGGKPPSFFFEKFDFELKLL